MYELHERSLLHRPDAKPYDTFADLADALEVAHTWQPDITFAIKDTDTGYIADYYVWDAWRYIGPGWYTFEREGDTQTQEAVWVENEDEYRDYSDARYTYYYGRGELPYDSDIRVAERYYWTLSPAARARYDRRWRA